MFKTVALIWIFFINVFLHHIRLLNRLKSQNNYAVKPFFEQTKLTRIGHNLMLMIHISRPLNHEYKNHCVYFKVDLYAKRMEKCVFFKLFLDCCDSYLISENNSPFKSFICVRNLMLMFQIPDRFHHFISIHYL